VSLEPDLPAVRAVWATAVAAFFVLASREAAADPQVHAAVTAGGGVRDLRDDPRGVFHLGAWTDVLFFRRKQTDVGFGPHLQLATASFQSFETGLGASLLLPTGGPVFILSAAPHFRVANGTVDAGATATIFFGSRSYNFSSIYGYQLGGFIEGRQGFTSRQTELYGGLHVDVAILALPFVFLAQALRN
jgi:hypothetical protein